MHAPLAERSDTVRGAASRAPARAPRGGSPGEARANAGPRARALAALRGMLDASRGGAPEGVAQMMRPHPRDQGRHFFVRYPRADSVPLVATYTGPGDTDGTFRFHSNSRGDFQVPEAQVDGYRPTVGLMHPPNQVRPEEDRLSDRSLVLLSEADLSGAMARQRRDPSLLDEMVVTTFEETPEYPDYEQNRRDLEALGVPILNSFDLQGGKDASRLEQLPHGSSIHFQMPRVPRSVSGYSTQKLVQDTLGLPEKLERDDLSVSITTPDPSMYRDLSTHNRFYGVKSGRAVEGTGMKLDTESSDSELEDFGYVHKESTQDRSAEVARKRRRFRFASRGARSVEVGDMELEEFVPAFRRTLRAKNRMARRLYDLHLGDIGAIYADLAQNGTRVRILPNGTLFFRLRGG
jgi:hypothetical protein